MLKTTQLNLSETGISTSSFPVKSFSCGVAERAWVLRQKTLFVLFSSSIIFNLLSIDRKIDLASVHDESGGHS